MGSLILHWRGWLALILLIPAPIIFACTRGVSALPVAAVIGTLAGVIFYVYDSARRNNPHQKEMAFTYLLFIVAIMSAAFPLISVHHDTVNEYIITENDNDIKAQEKANINLSSTQVEYSLCLPDFSNGTPCYLVGPDGLLEQFMIGHQPTAGTPKLLIDRFTIWEVVALFQTYMFAAIIFCELWFVYRERFTLPNVVLLGLLFLAFGLSWFYLTHGTSWWKKLSVTLTLASLILVIDGVFWWEARCQIQERYKQMGAPAAGRRFGLRQIGLVSEFNYICAMMSASQGSGSSGNAGTPASKLRVIAQEWVEYTCATRIAWVTDAVGVIAVATLLLCTIGWNASTANPSNFDHEIAARFSAGGTAISLMFSNLGLVAFRFLKHVELYHLEEKPTGLLAYLGLK